MQVLDDVDHMLTTQEGSLRKGSITGRASRATSRAVEAVRQGEVMVGHSAGMLIFMTLASTHA